MGAFISLVFVVEAVVLCSVAFDAVAALGLCSVAFDDAAAVGDGLCSAVFVVADDGLVFVPRLDLVVLVALAGFFVVEAAAVDDDDDAATGVAGEGTMGKVESNFGEAAEAAAC